MPAHKRVKNVPTTNAIVSVIATPSELRRATRISSPPDLFEIRLDCLRPTSDLVRELARLPAPVIITARHPAEGGENNLTTKRRRELLLRYLPAARYVDVELRSARALAPVLKRARRLGVGTIISFHDLKSTPSLGRLRAKAANAKALRAAVFKVATRTDTPVQLDRLLQFASESGTAPPLSIMGIGKLGAASRIILWRCQLVFTYTSLGKPRVDGQISLQQFRQALRAGPTAATSRLARPSPALPHPNQVHR